MIAAIIIGLVFIIAGQKPLGKGLILGTIFSVINFILIGETLPLRIGKTKGKPSPDVKKPISFFMTPTAQRNFRPC